MPSTSHLHHNVPANLPVHPWPPRARAEGGRTGGCHAVSCVSSLLPILFLFICFRFKNVFVYSSPSELGIALNYSGS